MFVKKTVSHILPLAAVAALATVPATAEAAPSRVVAKAASAQRGGPLVSFRLHGIKPRSIRRATLVEGRAHRRVALRKARAGAKRGVLTVRRRTALKPRLVLRLTAASSPDTTITTRRLDNGGRSATLWFTSTTRKATFSCRVDAKAWTACTSPLQLSGLGTGLHSVEIRAKDRAGKVDPTPATSVWTVTDATESSTPSAPATSTATTPTTTSTKPISTAPTNSAPLQGPGFTPLSDAEAASRVVRSSFEPRPANATYNNRVPTAGELETYYAARQGEYLCDDKYDLKVTGNFTGTTDEILQWAAYKWGLDPEMMRAIAVVESWWRASAGDATGGGLISVVYNVHKGTYPLANVSSAFNVDFLGAILRHYLDGCATWLNDVEHGKTYAAGDIWGAVGAWYAGRWYANDADWYINRIKQTMADRTWAQAGF
jgi:hypothetical protein